MVCVAAPFAAGSADRDLHDDVDAGVFAVSGKRGNGVPPAFAVAGVLFYLCSCRSGAAEGARGRQAPATKTSEAGTRRTASGPRPRAKANDSPTNVAFGFAPRCE